MCVRCIAFLILCVCIHELHWLECVCFVCVLPPLSRGRTAAAVTRTEQMGVKGCQNCTDWKARSEVAKAATHPATQECHSQQSLFLNRPGPDSSVNNKLSSKALVLQRANIQLVCGVHFSRRCCTKTSYSVNVGCFSLFLSGKCQILILSMHKRSVCAMHSGIN